MEIGEIVDERQTRCPAAADSSRDNINANDISNLEELPSQHMTHFPVKVAYRPP